MLFLYLIITFSLAIPAIILVHLHVCQIIFMCPPCSDTFSLQWMKTHENCCTNVLLLQTLGLTPPMFILGIMILDPTCFDYEFFACLNS